MGIESGFNVVAHGVIVASVVGGDTKKLLKLVGIRMAMKRGELTLVVPILLIMPAHLHKVMK